MHLWAMHTNEVPDLIILPRILPSSLWITVLHLVALCQTVQACMVW